MTLMKRYKYALVAHPGLAVVMQGRAEHRPLHFYVKTKKGPELRIRLEDFGEYDGLFISKSFVKYFKKPGVKEILITNTVSVFETEE
jgi:hypothetical protein